MEEFEEHLFLEDLSCDFGYPEGYGVYDGQDEGNRKKNESFLARCDKCSRSYRSLQGYNNHLKTHKMSDAYSGIPNFEELDKECPRLGKEVLESMLCNVPAVGKGPVLKSTIEDMLVTDVGEWTTFLSLLLKNLKLCLPALKNSPGRGSTYPTPPEIRTIFTKNVAEQLTSDGRKMWCMEFSSFISGVQENVLEIFVVGFIRRFSSKVLAFIISSMKKSVQQNLGPSSKKEKGDEEMILFQQTLHFVGGSVIRRVLNRALPLVEKYEKWGSIVHTIRTVMVTVDPSISENSELMSWTKAQDRGGLLFINESTLQFFTELGLLAEELEESNGSINHEKYLEKVFSSHVHVTWDNLIFDSLAKHDSHFLMEMLITYFLNTWGNGTAKKRMNSLFKTGTTNISLRPSLAGASRKQKR